MKKTMIILSTLATIGLSFGPGAFANEDAHGKFSSCVQQNGGTLPNLTADQRAAKKDCWKNNSDDKAKAKECIDALNLPKPDAKTQAAIKTCRQNWEKSNQSNG
jgi:hypothetical protein